MSRPALWPLDGNVTGIVSTFAMSTLTVLPLLLFLVVFGVKVAADISRDDVLGVFSAGLSIVDVDKLKSRSRLRGVGFAGKH